MDLCKDCDKYIGELCDKCVPNRFLEESRVIGCNEKFDELSSNEKYRFQRYGICPDCKEMNTGYAWCSKCDPGRFLREGMTSGTAEMDKLILDAQLQALGYYNHLEWIPFDRLKDIKPIGEGGFANVYSATWLDGKPETHREKRRTTPIMVALKKLKNLNNTIEAFAVKVIEYLNLLNQIIIK